MSAVRSFVTGDVADRARRITLDLAAEDHRALRLASVEDDTPMAEVLRALVALWRCDPMVRGKVHDLLDGEHQLGEPLDP